jgi:HEAT repeat protein
MAVASPGVARRETSEKLLRAVAAGDRDAFDELWEDVYHQGSVFPASVEAVPAFLGAAEHGDDPDFPLYMLAAMCVGRPPNTAARIREEARKGRELFRRLAGAGGIAALVASDAAGPEDVPMLRRCLADDRKDARANAALALGVLGETDGLERLVADDPEQGVRWAAAAALSREGVASERVVSALARGVVEGVEPDRLQGLPPWDELYPHYSAALNDLPADALGPAVPILLEALDSKDPWEVVDATEAPLGLTTSDDVRDEALRRIARNRAGWKRPYELGRALEDHGLPGTRDELRARLAG